MWALPGWLRLHRTRDFDQEGRDWLRRLCGPPPRHPQGAPVVSERLVNPKRGTYKY
jgi:hypothetical protein